jgi:peptide/nickel transport system permease protein
MLTVVVRRVLSLIPVLFVISIITFALMSAVPGSPFSTEDKPLPPQIQANLEAYYDLDRPLFEQYLTYMGNVLRGDLGPSYMQRNRSVNDIIAAHLPVSAVLGVLGLAVAVLVGLPMGIFSALRPNTWIDHAAMFFAVAGVSVPAMTLGPLLIWFFALELGWLPVARWGTWQQAVLPAITLGIGHAAVIARLTRASMLQVVHEDFIRTARAKGLPETKVLVRHALSNAAVPIITIIGIGIALLIGGAVVTESVFAIPGLGRLTVDAILRRDYPVIQGVVLLFSFTYVLVNLFIDILYTLFDPRIRY